MPKQLTLALLKPILCHFPERIIKVREMIRHAGLSTILSKKLNNWDKLEASRFYGSHQGRFFFSRLVFTMTNGPVEILVLEGENAVSVWRDLMGPTHVWRARREFPDTIRGRFALSDTKNCVHGSDSIESAMKEITFFFPDFRIQSYEWNPCQLALFSWRKLSRSALPLNATYLAPHIFIYGNALLFVALRYNSMCFRGQSEFEDGEQIQQEYNDHLHSDWNEHPKLKPSSYGKSLIEFFSVKSILKITNTNLASPSRRRCRYCFKSLIKSG